METLPVARYWLRLLPQARRELAYWTARARTVGDPVERSVASSKLAGEHHNIQSAAFFALLAEDWRSALRRVTTFQLAYELLDGLNEQSPDDGLRLHGALIYAVGAPVGRTGGYLGELIDACRPVTSPSDTLLGAVRRVGEAQTHNHMQRGLKDWAEAYAPSLFWWEAAAAGVSSLGVLAMLCSPPIQHDQIMHAYLKIDALAGLLDALVDRSDDQRSGGHNWLDHYPPRQASDRLNWLVHDAERAIVSLPNTAIHQMLLAGLLAHNLAACEKNTTARRLLNNRPLVRSGVLILRAYRIIPRGGSSLLTTIQN